MNIFISGSTSILASAVIESYFGQESTLYIRDDLPDNEAEIHEALGYATAFRPMDVVMILDGDEVFNTGITRKYINTVPSKKIKEARAICRYFANQPDKPKILLLASSVSIYESGEEDTSAENTLLGADYPAKYFRKLELATKAAEDSGIRILHLRFGNVISKNCSPALPKLPFNQNYIPITWKDRKQWASWISREDAARAIIFLIKNEAVTSPVNVTSGRALSKKVFLSTIADRFNLKLTPPLINSLLSFIAGRDRAALYTANTNSVPEKLMKAGFSFENTSMPEYFNR